ncbi:MAG: histidinol-phosphate transaminase [Cycloclasticus sp.]|nr:histidinol-phosphate transaminase [Cycloclasticus sp.]MBG95611.1 histidinol-phosphate transaminase [Cycloclasticus sp.]HAI97044.1 histidinol-phosphate transaminase [Methylococcaceae bacterium]
MSKNNKKLESLVRPEIRAMSAYHVPEATGLVKLDAMENPFAWPIEMKEEWLQLLSDAEPNRYPDPSAKELVASLRHCFGVPSELGVVLGNGSDELIQLILMAMHQGASIMAPTPSFVMYRHIATSLSLPFVSVPLNGDFSLDVPTMISEIERHDPAVIFLAYPNNPTANLFHDEDIRAILNAANGLVVIDEAYQPFARKSFLNRVSEHENLIVLRTVSKLGLAGLRLGFLVGHNNLTDDLEKIRLPYNINIFTQLTATFAFKHMDVLDGQAAILCNQRERLLKKLSSLSVVRVFPSEANFILFSLLSDSAERVFEELKEAGVLIKKMGHVPGLPDECLRVTVGTRSENDLFFEKIGSILK